jgi:hypothetical protein
MLRLFPTALGSITTDGIEDIIQNRLYVEDNFVTTSTLLPANNFGGNGSSTVTTLSSAVPLLDVTNCLQLSLSNNTAQSFVARSGNVGRCFLPGQWDATFFVKFIIGAVTPQIAVMNNSFFLAGFASTSSIPNLATVDNASINFLYDTQGVGIRVSSGSLISTYRPGTAVFLAPNVAHSMRLVVYKALARAEVYINKALVLTANTVNFPAYNNVNRGMFPFIQHARLLVDVTNPAPTVYVDNAAMLLSR